MEVTGILMRKLNEREGVSQRNGYAWKIAEYLVEIPGQYPRHINFRVSDGQTCRIAHFDGLIGKTVTVSFDIDAHEHDGRWFNEINAWGVMEYVAGRKIPQTIFPQENDGGKEANTSEPTPPTTNGKTDDLPF